MSATANATATDLDFDVVHDYTHNKRKVLVEHLEQGLQNRDAKDMSVYLKALDGMDKAATNKRRLDIDDKAQQSSSEQQAASAELLKQIRAQMFQTPATGVQRAAPTLDDTVPAPELVPGETEVGVANMTYDSFQRGLPEDEKPAS